MENEKEQSTLKVLIVDDNRLAANCLVRLISALGWNAQAFYSGSDLLTYLYDQHADIAFVDIGMPEMDGYEVVNEIRTRGYILPVVALSGYGLQEDIEKALSAGFTAHLTKPVGALEFKAMLSELLSLKVTE
ncbi:response regulator [Patescibacteria group bacterium]|nr:response regulator [Patescibacteria group bacterium]